MGIVRSWAAGLAPLALAGCGGGGEPVAGALHLDLALADGRSPTAVTLETMGADGAGLEPSGSEGDWGLVPRDRDARRAWPADLGVALFTECVVPRGGRLVTACTTKGGKPLRFSVDVREGGASWSLLGEAVSKGVGWTPLELDLSNYGGEAIELRFLVTAEGKPDPRDGKPRRVVGFWGSPTVRGELVADRRPNVVLITLDTTRADALGAGYSPNLDALAERGARYANAFATTNSTIPSHASILTGLALEEHGAVGNRYTLGQANVTLAERLRAAGYETGAAVSVGHLAPGIGFGQGFDRFALPRKDAFRNGAPTVAAAAEMLAGWSGADAPFFLWLHLFDPHTPYGPPAEFAKKYAAKHGLKPPPRMADPATMPVWDEPPQQLDFLQGMTNREHVEFLYHLSVAYADFLVGRFLDELERHGLDDDTLIVVTSDHGEAMGEHDAWFEHVSLYSEVLHVPLIVAGPGVPAGETIEEPVSLIDLAPTLMRRCALLPDEGLDGRDLFALDADSDRRLWFQLSGGWQAGFRDERHHFIETLEDGHTWIAGAETNAEGRRVPRYASEPRGTKHLFEHASDPGLEKNLAPERGDVVARCADEVAEWLATRESARQTRRDMTAEEEAELEKLGYAGGQ